MLEGEQNNLWPLPKFYFTVRVGDLFEAKFQEVSGLEVEPQVIEYRHGNSPEFSSIKMPGISKFGNVTLKKGIFKGDNRFLDWFNKIKMGVIERQPVTIKLLDESGAPTMVWTLKNAWPTKITGTDMKSEGDEVAVESLEMAHEGIEINS